MKTIYLGNNNDMKKKSSSYKELLDNNKTLKMEKVPKSKFLPFIK